MAQKKPKTFAEEIESLYDTTPRDWDPENEGDGKLFADSDEEVTRDEEGRDHYVDVGESALRRREDLDLGPSYTSAKVDRQKLQNDAVSSDGASIYDSDSESRGSSDSASESAEDVGSFSGFESGADSADSESRSSSSGSTASSMSKSHSESSAAAAQRAEARSLMSDAIKPSAALVRLAHADIEKGRAIKRQRIAFDSLLQTRIKLQKALVSANTLSTVHSSIEDSEMRKQANGADNASAESAAMDLLNSLSQLRTSFASTESVAPPPFTTTTPSSQIAETLLNTHTTALPHRRAILTKWSQRTQPPTPLSRGSASKKFSQAPAQTPLTAVLDHQLRGDQLERHVQKTRVPRSCAPVQAAQRTGQENGPRAGVQVYDDADFYALLLRELVEQRSTQASLQSGSATNAASDPKSTTNGAAQRQSSVAEGVEVPRLRDVKVRKVVDRKASKGRKMRYTVHEKLENFMVKEDRGSWGERRREELFAGLLGRKVEQQEEEDGIDAGESGGEDGGGIRLFG